MAYINQYVRMKVFRKHKMRCAECRLLTFIYIDEAHDRRATIDHIIPRSHGGGNCQENLQLLCRRCNREKGLDEQRALNKGSVGYSNPELLEYKKVLVGQSQRARSAQH